MGCVTGRYIVDGFFASQLLPHKNSTWSCLLTKYLLKSLIKNDLWSTLMLWRKQRKSLRTLKNCYSRMEKRNTLRNEENWEKAAGVQFSCFPHLTISTHCAYSKIFSRAKMSAWNSRKLLILIILIKLLYDPVTVRSALGPGKGTKNP